MVNEYNEYNPWIWHNSVIKFMMLANDTLYFHSWIDLVVRCIGDHIIERYFNIYVLN